MDTSIEVDDFADSFDISKDWPHAEACIQFTQSHAELLTRARALAMKPESVRFPIEFQSVNTLLPEVQGVRAVGWVLQLDAQVAMHLGDKERAFKDLVALFELTKPVDSVPFVVAQLSGVAIRRSAFEALQKALELNLLDRTHLMQLDAILLPRCEIGDRWQTMVTDEMCSNLPVFEKPHVAWQATKLFRLVDTMLSTLLASCEKQDPFQRKIGRSFTRPS